MTKSDNNFNLMCIDQMVLMIFDNKESMSFVRTEANKEATPFLFRT